MEVDRVTAKRFYRVLDAGRSRPSLIAADGDGKEYEVVVKPSSGNERGATASVAELVCNLLATELGLSAPQPFLVEIPSGFDALVPDVEARRQFADVRGPQFGCQFLLGQTISAPFRNVPANKRDEALAVLLFDALVQNADRRDEKPNILEHGEGYFLIDHDLALTCFGGMLIGGPTKPWVAAHMAGPSFEYLKRHIFYEGLRGKEVDASEFLARLKGLTEARLESIFDSVPALWWPSGLRGDLKSYLLDGISNAGHMVNFVRSILNA